MSIGGDQLRQELAALVGRDHLLGPDELSTRPAGIWRADTLQAAALVRPGSTQEVSDVLAWCRQHGVSVVPQGGLTGLVHGADASPEQVILSLERLRQIESIAPAQRAATVQAGVTVQALQEAVEAHGLQFPLDLGARGTATLGGCAATNAGGNRVIRYGMLRNMVLGLEVVLADGTVLSSLSPLIKNNTGYDLKQLFIGSEGTLGVITRLCLRLWEQPRSHAMALVGVADFAAVKRLLRHMDQALGGSLSAFEVMWRDFYRLVTTPPARGRPPLSGDYPFHVLLESQGADPEHDRERFQTALEDALAAGLISDAAVAHSEADCRDFWSLRDDVAQTLNGGATMIFDVSLPIDEMEAYTRGLATELDSVLASHHLWIFGHLGDGNLHVAVQVANADFNTARPLVEAAVYRPLAAFQGSVSAEHGIGLEKKPWLPVSRSDAEITVMRSLKGALDPAGILNPGKIFSPASG